MTSTGDGSRVAEVRRRVGALDVLALTAALWFLAKFLRYALPPLFGTFQRTYGVSNTELGVVFTGLLLGYAAMQFPSGALADRIGTVRVIVGGAVVAAIAALLLFASSSYVALVLAVVLVGVGTGAHKTVAITLLSTVYPERTGRALGIMDTVGELGGVAAPAVVVAVLAAAVDWRYLFLAAAVVALGVAGLFRLRAAERISDAEAESADGNGEGSGSAGEYAAAFAAPRFTAFAAVAVLFSFGMNGIVAFLPLYLTDAAGLGTGFAGALYSAFYAVAVVQPLTGDLGDRYGRLRVVALTLGLGTAGLLTLVVLVDGGPLVLGAGVVALGLGLHGVRPARDAHLVEVIPDDVAGGTLGIVRTAMLLAGAAAPTIVGYVADVASFRPAFGVLVVALLAGLSVVTVLAVVGEEGTGRGDPAPDA
ncbi:MAG: MFS transporter [Haloferacaceae archaeon]